MCRRPDSSVHRIRDCFAERGLERIPVTFLVQFHVSLICFLSHSAVCHFLTSVTFFVAVKSFTDSATMTIEEANRRDSKRDEAYHGMSADQHAPLQQ